MYLGTSFHTSHRNRDKLEVKEKKCIVIGYGLDDMGYHFRDNNIKRVIRSRYMTINENALYKEDLVATSNETKKSKGRKKMVLDRIYDESVANPSNVAKIGKDSRTYRSSRISGKNGVSGSEASNEGSEVEDGESEVTKPTTSGIP